jgi:serine/threonine protein kinase
MGEVWRAVQKSLGRLVAVKTLKGISSGNSIERFLREGRVVARLNHSNIVHVYGRGKLGDDRFFLAMEYIPGRDLQAEINHAQISIERSVQIALDVCNAIGHAHQRGVIHRDLKPANVLGAEKGQIKVADFGLAKILDIDEPILTGTKDVFGTPHYMAPEQCEPNGRWGRISPLVDVYAIGGILYAMLAGKPPYEGLLREIQNKILSEEMPILPSRLRPDVPKELERICFKCLSKRQADRYQSAVEISRDLENFARSREHFRRSTSRIDDLLEIVQKAAQGNGYFHPPAAMTRTERNAVTNCRIPSDTTVLGIIDCQGWYFWMTTTKFAVFTNRGIYFGNGAINFREYSDIVNEELASHSHREVIGRHIVYRYDVACGDAVLVASPEPRRIQSLYDTLSFVRFLLTRGVSVDGSALRMPEKLN